MLADLGRPVKKLISPKESPYSRIL